MKLIDGIKQKGRPFEIPDCSRDDLPDFFVQMGYKVGAEIGINKGDYTKKLLEKGLKVYAVDPWLDYSSYRHDQGQARLDFLYEHAMRTLAAFPNCTVIKKPSMEAVQTFEDSSLDFVYIDGNHLLKHVVEDITEWSKKIRTGGIVSGHDYFQEDREHTVVHTAFAVNAYTGAYKVKNWYILGRNKLTKGEKRDRWRSWMWIKDYNEPSPFVNF